MYQKKSRQCCAAMLIVSVCLRLCMFLGLDEQLGQLFMQTAKSKQTAEFLLYLETGKRIAPEPIPTPTAVVYLQPVQTETQQPPPEPVQSVKTVPAQEITISGNCSYPFDAAALLAQQSSLCVDPSPQILVVQSHTTEAYAEEDGLTYEKITDYRTLDETRNMLAVGDVLVQELRQRGFTVFHDRSIHDYPNYNSSYWNCLQSITWWKQKYPDVQLIIDLHRDAVENEQGQAIALCSEQAGQQTAQLMLVVGTNEGGLEHPDWQENLANALKLQSVLMGEYPGLCRHMDLRTERFNQHAAPGAILVEVGTNGNTLTQAKASAALLADGIAKFLTAMEQNEGTLPPS